MWRSVLSSRDFRLPPACPSLPSAFQGTFFHGLHGGGPTPGMNFTPLHSTFRFQCEPPAACLQQHVLAASEWFLLCPSREAAVLSKAHVPLTDGVGPARVFAVWFTHNEGRWSPVRLCAVVQARQGSEPWVELVHLQRGEGNSLGATREGALSLRSSSGATVGPGQGPRRCRSLTLESELPAWVLLNLTSDNLTD